MTRRGSRRRTPGSGSSTRTPAERRRAGRCSDGYAAASGRYILSMDCDFVLLVPELRDLFDAVASGPRGGDREPLLPRVGADQLPVPEDPRQPRRSTSLVRLCCGAASATCRTTSSSIAPTSSRSSRSSSPTSRPTPRPASSRCCGLRHPGSAGLLDQPDRRHGSSPISAVWRFAPELPPGSDQAPTARRHAPQRDRLRCSTSRRQPSAAPCSRFARRACGGCYGW